MQIFIGNKFIGELPINFENIDKTQIINEMPIFMIPYHHESLLGYAKFLIDDLISTVRPTWKFPDYNNFKCYIYIENMEYRISLEVYPEIMSTERRTNLLENANKAIREDGYSDYYEIQDAFDSADTFYTDDNPFGEIWSYHMQPTAEESKLLAQLIET